MRIPSLLFVTVACALPVAVGCAAGKGRAVSFEDAAVGVLPAGWRTDATNPKGPPATWAVVGETRDGSATKSLALTKIEDTSRGVFNLCIAPVEDFGDGAVSVRLKALTGAIDQGGGVCWRLKDARNYYIARYNPLEKNYRVYVVKDGTRTMLAEAKDITLAAGQWFTLKIEQRGDAIKAYLDGALKVETKDATFAAPGAVALWSKADAATAFDDLEIGP